MRGLPRLIPHRAGCADFPRPVLHGRASLMVVLMTRSVTRWQRKARRLPRVSNLASPAIRCRCVDRFVRLKVLSHVSRQRFSPHGTPLSSIGSRWVQFPDVTGTIKVLRLPATPVRSLIGFASGVHAILLGSCLAACAPGRSEGRPGQGLVQPATPNSRFARAWTWTGPPRFPGDPSRAYAPLFDPGRTDDPSPRDGVAGAAPALPTAKASALVNFGAQSRGFSTRCLRFTNDVATTHAKLASGWLARLYREGVEPSGSLQKVSVRLILLFWT